MDTQAAHRTLAEHLKTTGKQRSTPARRAVLDAVMQTKGHFDVENLYYRLISSGVKISKASVYNTLDVLQECGLVSKYRFAEGKARYEKSFDRPHHHHLICLSCGDIVEFTSEKLERLQEDVCAQNGFKFQSTTLQIFGACTRCTKH